MPFLISRLISPDARALSAGGSSYRLMPSEVRGISSRAHNYTHRGGDCAGKCVERANPKCPENCNCFPNIPPRKATTSTSIFPSINMTDEHVHSQHESKLLSVPAEIRRAIYAEIFHGQTHAFLSQGRIHLSVCFQPNLGDDCHDGRERGTTAEKRRDDPRWVRCLRSSWGPHWECEQAAYPEKTDLHEHRRHHAYDLFSVCKKM